MEEGETQQGGIVYVKKFLSLEEQDALWKECHHLLEQKRSQSFVIAGAPGPNVLAFCKYRTSAGEVGVICRMLSRLTFPSRGTDTAFPFPRDQTATANRSTR